MDFLSDTARRFPDSVFEVTGTCAALLLEEAIIMLSALYSRQSNVPLVDQIVSTTRDKPNRGGDEETRA